MIRRLLAVLALLLFLALPASAVDPTPRWAPLPSSAFRGLPDRAAAAEAPIGTPNRHKRFMPPASQLVPSPPVASPAASSASARSMPALSGTASYYPAPAGVAAAGPRLRTMLGAGWRGRSVLVCAGRCVRVTLSDWCQCYGSRVIDLSAEAFRQLAPLSAGLVKVTVR